MEPPPTFRIPPPASALHPLSPERVNGARPSRRRKQSATDYQAIENSQTAPKSPMRKANPFADFSFSGRSPVREPGAGLPQSPSLPEITALRGPARTNSDVQGLVKRFEHLDVRDRDAESAESRRRHDAELGRAQIAREEAETDVKRLREEMRRMKKEADESHDRERKVGKRLEIVMEDYASSKETFSSQAAVYEKEVRKSRKEAFKSSSAVLKLQEELKSTRNSLRATQSTLDLEKRKVQQKEQETFNAQYQLVSLQEELDNMKSQTKIVEEEREALKTSLKEEEVARVTAEGMIALPTSTQDDDDLLNSPRKRSPQKRPASPLSDDKENVGIVTKKALEAKSLAYELMIEGRKRQKVEELVEFLRLECRFHCCSCRSAQTSSREHTLNVAGDFAEAVEKIRKDMQSVLTFPTSNEDETVISAQTAVRERSVVGREPRMVDESTDVDMDHAPEVVSEDEVDQSVTMADDAVAGCSAPDAPMRLLDELPIAPRPTPVDPLLNDEEGLRASQTAQRVPLQPSSPQTPQDPLPTTPFRRQPLVRTVTTTTTIPMHFTPAKPSSRDFNDAENIPPTATLITDDEVSAPTFDRAAALAAIAYRRGRAKSIADGHVTPRKQMMEGINLKERRDISAPALGQKVGAVNFAKGAASVGRAAGRRVV